MHYFSLLLILLILLMATISFRMGSMTGFGLLLLLFHRGKEGDSPLKKSLHQAGPPTYGN